MLVRLRQQLIQDETWPGVEFFRHAIAELEGVGSEVELQAFFTDYLGATGPLANLAGFEPHAVLLLDEILATAQDIALTFSVDRAQPQ